MTVNRVPVPENEEERLKALQAYDILDTFPEKEYDAITRLASYICHVPLAFISFIDERRQWFKSKVGLPIDEIPRADAFCRYTIMDDVLVEVPDFTQSEIFAESEFVKSGPMLRFYASAPLIDDEGFRLGSLCVFDQQPKHLTAEQRDALQTLAGEVISHLSLRKQKKELERNLEAHQEFYRLFNNSSEIHCIAAASSQIEMINQAAEKILGYSPDQIIGRSLWDFVADHDREQYVPLIESGQRTGQSFEMETTLVTRRNERKCLSWTVKFDNDKWYASGRDITQHKKAQDELKQLSLVASKVFNGVAISNADNKIIWINDAFANITGFNLDDVRNRELIDVLNRNETDTTLYDNLHKQLETQQAFEMEFHILHKNDNPMWISVLNSPVFNAAGEIEKYIKVIIDITDRKAAEQQLEIMSFASRKSPSGVLIRDRESRVIWMNEAMEGILGYTFTEMEGKTFGGLLIGEDTDLDVFGQALKAYADNKPYEIELKIYRKDGTPVWTFLSNSPLFNEEGQVERQITVCLDITDRKKAEEELTLLSLVASATVSGVVINDHNGQVEWVNHAFENITGYDLSHVQGKRLGDVIRGEATDYASIEQAREQSRNKQSFTVDIQAYRKDGTPVWLSVINSVILDDKGEVNKYIEVLIDITAKKQVEHELIAAREEALQLSRAKDMFISVMSHEIRTPLNAVIGMSHLLLEDNPAEAQKENLNVLRFSAENLMTLINDVLDFTKMETGNIELEKARVDLRELVQSVTSSMQFKAHDKQIYLRHTIDPTLPDCVLGDRTRLVQILLNIAGNSLKFTEKGGVTIDVQVVDQTLHEARIRFAVTDTGIGIAPDKINTIFESFKQAEADTTRKYGGTGLGLAITKRLVELHGSHIKVESVPGQGSVFEFTISFKKADNSPLIMNNITEAGLKINVLVADDNQINRLLISKVLKRWGITPDFAENGAQAVEKVEANANYDVVLMDIHMPEMDGLQATQAIRSKADAYFKQLPIIALTASMLNNQMHEIKEAGMNDYVLKPFDPKVLYDKLSRYQQQ